MDIYDGPLIVKLKNGDSSSFEVIYKSHYRRIFHFALQYLHDEEVCSNIIQDVFSSLWDNKEKLLTETNLNAWLFTVTKNRCLKYIRDLKSEERHLGNLAEQRMSLIHDALNSLDTSPYGFSGDREDCSADTGQPDAAMQEGFRNEPFRGEKVYRNC